MTDTELLNALERLFVTHGVMMRTCRSGIKLELGFEGYGPVYTFFGGIETGALHQGVGQSSRYFVESARGDTLGTNVRSLIRKALEQASKT